MKQEIPINRQAALSDPERRALRLVAALMIPADAEYGVPGADDDAVFADVIRSLGRDADAVRKALRRLDELAGGVFADRPTGERLAATQRLHETDAAHTTVLVNVIVRCYYRDDRVMRSLGMEPRAPFPKGFEVEQGDWSLLDPVKARPSTLRRTP